MNLKEMKEKLAFPLQNKLTTDDIDFIKKQRIKLLRDAWLKVQGSKYVNDKNNGGL